MIQDKANSFTKPLGSKLLHQTTWQQLIFFLICNKHNIADEEKTITSLLHYSPNITLDLRPFKWNDPIPTPY